MTCPILYPADTVQTENLGLGVLSSCISCTVTEERNGVYELEMQYPADGVLFSELKPDRLVKCSASYRQKDQLFRIVRVSKPIGGICQIYAEHVSYLAEGLQLKPSVQVANKTAAEALKLWSSAITTSHPFTVESDITRKNSTVWALDTVEHARKALGGATCSILDQWGGEYQFDNYHIRLLSARGRNRGVVIAYGKNLTDLNQEENIADTYTSLYPYCAYTEGEKDYLITLDPPYYLDSPGAKNFARRKILKVSFSDIKTKSALKSAAEAYIVEHGIGIPRVNLELSYLDLSKTLEYTGNLPEQVELCDEVTVYFAALSVYATAKVIKTVWNVLAGQYDSIEIGDAKHSISTELNEIKSRVEAKSSRTDLTAAIARAEQDITGNSGGNIVLNPARNPEQIRIMDAYSGEEARNILRLDGSGITHTDTQTGAEHELVTIDGKLTGVLYRPEDEMENPVPSEVHAGELVSSLSFLSYEHPDGHEPVGISASQLLELEPSLVQTMGESLAVNQGRLLCYALKAIAELRESLAGIPEEGEKP